MKSTLIAALVVVLAIAHGIESKSLVKRDATADLEELTKYFNTFQAQALELLDTVKSHELASKAVVLYEAGKAQAEKQLEPYFPELRQNVDAKVEELRQKIEPMVTDIREKADTMLEEVKTKVKPYVEDIVKGAEPKVDDIKVQVSKIVEQLKEQNQALIAQIEPYVTDIRETAEPKLIDFRNKISAVVESYQAHAETTLNTLLEKAKEMLQQ